MAVDVRESVDPRQAEHEARTVRFAKALTFMRQFRAAVERGDRAGAEKVLEDVRRYERETAAANAFARGGR